MMKLLEISDASVDKATSLVEQVMGDNAKLLKLVAEKEEEAAGWKMLHEQSSASEMTLKAVVEELMDVLPTAVPAISVAPATAAAPAISDAPATMAFR